MGEITTNNEAKENDYEIVINIANDYYKAYMTINVHSPNLSITQETLMEALKNKNITYGISLDAINSIIQNPSFATNVLVAVGKPHENGVNGEITYNFSTEKKIKPTLQADGKVNFKELNLLQMAYEGDVLATRTMPTEGSDGMTVTGKLIKAKPGKIKNFKIGKNVAVEEDGLSVVATETGNIEFDGEKIVIIKVLEIKGDVGVETGNIEFNGKVIVNGNVTTGFSVQSDEAIEVNGLVESANLISGGDILISGGVQGNDLAKIECKGNLISKFLNNCHAVVEGNIEADSIMHCHIVCDGTITAQGRRGLIIGGEINVRQTITAKTIGSDMGTITKLRLGVDSKIMEAYQDALQEQKDMKETLKKVNQAYMLLKRQFEATGNLQQKAMMEKTQVSVIEYKTRLDAANKQVKEISELIESLRGSKVNGNAIYPGVKVRIGNSFYNVKDVLKDVTILKEDGDIRTMVYTK